MKESVIISAYNEEKTIADIVISCCEILPHSEIVVVDDGSIDNTENILTELTEKYSFVYERLVNFNTHAEALKREKQLKSRKGREWLRNVVLPYFL